MTDLRQAAEQAREALRQSVWLYENYGLLAQPIEGDPLAAGRWVGEARTALASLEEALSSPTKQEAVRRDDAAKLVQEFGYCLSEELRARPWTNALADKTEAARTAVLDFLLASSPIEAATPDLNALMAEHGISVWMDPDWWQGSGLPRWLAGKNMRAVEGTYYGTLTGSDPSSIEADNTCSGETPLAAVLAVIEKAKERKNA